MQVLELVADYLCDASLLLDASWHGLDRLLYLACTGGPGVTVSEQWHISQAAVAVLRACLQRDPALAQDCLLAALAPPPEQVGEGMDATETSQTQLQAAAVPRLLQTVAEHLQAVSDKDSEDTRQGVGLVGALSALSLFAGTTEAQKSLLLKLSTPSLLHDAWERLAVECEFWQTLDNKSSGTSEESVAKRQMSQTIVLSILRWVGSWMTDAPLVVQGFLQDPSSAQIMGQLVKQGSSKNDNDEASRLIGSVASLVLGVSLVYLPTDATADCGGWTPDTIVHVLGRLPTRMIQWDDLKKQKQSSSSVRKELLPWTCNTVEAMAWQSWVSSQVLQVRKALIHFMAGSGPGNDDNDDNDGDAPADGGPSRKSLQTMLAQQAEEMERLRNELQESQRKVQSQGRSEGNEKPSSKVMRA